MADKIDFRQFLMLRLPKDVDAILSAVPRGDAIELVVTAGLDAPTVPDDLASRALPLEEVA